MSANAIPSPDLDYQFTITDGQVAAMQAVRNGQAHDLPLPAHASFQVGAATVAETLAGNGPTTLIVYAQEAGSPQLYRLADVTTTYAHPSTAQGGVAFHLDDGVVVGGLRVVGGAEHSLDSPLDTVFSGGSGMVLEQSVTGNEIRTVTFVQPEGSTLYAVGSVEKTYIDPGAATTFLDVQPIERMEFTFDAGGNVAQAQRLDLKDGLHTVTDRHISFIRLGADGADHSYVEKVTTYGSKSSYEVYYAGQSGNGVYTEVAHGSGSSVDLAGLKTQVQAAEQSLLTGASTTSATGWII